MPTASVWRTQEPQVRETSVGEDLTGSMGPSVAEIGNEGGRRSELKT